MLHSTAQLGLIALLVLGGAGMAANAYGTAADGLACGVSTSNANGMLSVEGMLQSPEALTGDYRFALKSQGAGGSSNINQGGQFSATPGMPVSLGKVSVNAGANIEVDFTITTGGKKYDCSQQFTTQT
jgi:hypothetical protein